MSITQDQRARLHGFQTESQRLLIRPLENTAQDRALFATMIDDIDIKYQQIRGHFDISEDDFERRRQQYLYFSRDYDSYREEHPNGTPWFELAISSGWNWMKPEKLNRLYAMILKSNPNKMIGELYLLEDDEGRLRLAYYCVPDYRRQGFAMEGYRAVMDAMAFIGEPLIYAETSSKFPVSIAFLKANGFSVVGDQKGATNNPNFAGENVLYLQRTNFSPRPGC